MAEHSEEIKHVEHLTAEEHIAVAEIKRRILALVGGRLTGFYLFGSKARGDFNSESDVDIAILVKELDKETKRKIIDIVVETETEFVVVISSLVLSWEDFSLLKERERRIAHDIEHEGIAL